MLPGLLPKLVTSTRVAAAAGDPDITVMTAKSAAAQALASAVVNRLIHAPPFHVRGAPRIRPPPVGVGCWKIRRGRSTVNACLVCMPAGSPGNEPFLLVIACLLSRSLITGWETYIGAHPDRARY